MNRGPSDGSGVRGGGRYYRTGDAANRDAEAYVFFTGRNDGMITRAGYPTLREVSLGIPSCAGGPTLFPSWLDCAILCISKQLDNLPDYQARSKFPNDEGLFYCVSLHITPRGRAHPPSPLGHMAG